MKTLPLAVFSLLAVAACAGAETKPIGMPNPASKYCVDSGGRSEIRKAADGSQSGVCVFSDGRTVDEWEMYRSNHPQR